RDEHSFVEPVVHPGRHEKRRRRAEVVLGRIHVLAVGQAPDHLGRSVPDTAIADLDQHAVGRLEQVDGFGDRDTVAANELPVRTAAEHLAVQRRTRERAVEDRDHAPQPLGRLADDDGLAEPRLEAEHEVEIRVDERHAYGAYFAATSVTKPRSTLDSASENPARASSSSTQVRASLSLR